jgi:LacI family transcriptional regulator
MEDPLAGEGTVERGATLSSVARAAGVSRQTVSNALNFPERLHPDTLSRVKRAIEQLGYRPHQAARSLRLRSSHLIGYCVESLGRHASSQILDRFLHAFSETADEAGYRILLFPAPSPEAELAAYENLLREQSVDAFVLSHTARGDRRPLWLTRHGIPFVAFGRMWGAKQVGDWVDVDGCAGVRDAVEHLVERGHRRIGFLGWPRGSGVGDDRAAGWRAALREHDLPTQGLRVACEEDVDAAQVAAGPLLDRNVTAVVAVSDTLAIGCYRALRSRGLQPGTDVAVVGFDDSALATLISPGLSSVAQPLEHVGSACVRLLLDRIAQPDAAPKGVLLPPRLVIRESSAGSIAGG